MRKYFMYDGQMKDGPFSLEELKTKPLKKETLIWYDGLKDWGKAGDIDDLKEFFIQKAIPPPLPVNSKVNTRSRDKILETFTDADEMYPEPKKRSLLLPVIIVIVTIAAISTALFFFHSYLF